MSGMKNLANAMAHDRSFKADGYMSKSEAAKFVPQTGSGSHPHPGSGKKSTPVKNKGSYGKSSGGSY